MNSPTLQSSEPRHNGTPFRLKRHIIGCGREGVHLCRVMSLEMLLAVWPWMEKGLLKIKATNSPNAHWLPDHIRFEIQKGLAGQSATECFLAHDGDTEAITGFVVAYPEFDPFVHLPFTWFAWMAYGEGGLFQATYLEFEAMARARGYKRVKWSTSQLGWAQAAERFGATIVEYTVAKEIG